MLKTSDILHEGKSHFVVKAKYGFEVHRNGITHATRCAIIGYEGKIGLDKAIAEIERREKSAEINKQITDRE